MIINLNGMDVEVDKISLIRGINEIHVVSMTNGTYGIQGVTNQKLVSLEETIDFPSNLIQDHLKA